MSCLFCDIIQKRKEALIVYEDSAAVAVLDVFPRAKGHVLVLPRRHVETILELTDEEIGPLWQVVRNVIKLLEEKLTPQGFTIGINHGKVSGQAIEHLHIHIMPRYEGDEGGSLHSVVNAPGGESLEEVYKKLL
ncbi:hypothetical protein A2755_00825 [Candidatus Wolfebacteria bacterium RIFCSPHIGHO2_01_FULL_48_22]|uniref:HIT domain-containing protein n=2 Tax=Candidatus Wolfeibacteriota TaxID=1752735 RepID=A0A1F8DTH7_9BACT|nr:MAG: hypothetical protein A2755_00825 [Candidatus Wolfebacteria bacterium RIFCSPHIGHO2_01_FULL_48_22]OGM93559.1 MAG: hypothetical protein A2935_02940 [Candidatus Wolfebacteria bacterium RIFCSPLOWO2_01_FULL_47_17b]